MAQSLRSRAGRPPGTVGGGRRSLPRGFTVRVIGRPGAGEPGTPPPALHLGGSLEEPGPREGSRLPSPEAQPGLPAPSGGLRNLRRGWAQCQGRAGEGLPGPPAPAAASPPRAGSPDGAHLLARPRLASRSRPVRCQPPGMALWAGAGLGSVRLLEGLPRVP